jgi:hypothetical protein
METANQAQITPKPAISGRIFGKSGDFTCLFVKIPLKRTAATRA